MINNIMLKMLQRKSFFGRLLLLVRKIILKFYDPTITYMVGDKEMLLKLSHMLPIYKVTHSLYDTALPRIVKYFVRSKKNIYIIDVGANIGDTAALILESSNQSNILCIEGSNEFANLLKMNFENDERVIIEVSFLTDKYNGDNKKLISQNGTASLITLENDIQVIPTITLDDLLLSKYHNFQVDILKVDTDGYDYKVLRGAKQTLVQYKPLIYFELVPMLLKNNNEDIMSVFHFLSDLTYSDVMLYDNLGYLLGLFEIKSLKNIEMLIEYIDSKNMYLDVLVSSENLNHLYQSELESIKSIEDLKKLKFRYGYKNRGDKW